MGSKIHKEQVINNISERTGWSKTESASNLQWVLDTLAESLLDNDRITLTGFGTFDVRPTPAKRIRVIGGENAGEMREIAPSHRVAFAASKVLLKKVRGSR